MKIGDLVLAKDDCSDIHKGDICRVKEIKGYLIYIEYSEIYSYTFSLKEHSIFFGYFFKYFYTTQEMRKMKLKKLNHESR